MAAVDTKSNAPDRVRPVPVPHRLMWRDHEVASMLGISRSLWLRMHRYELCPAPVKMGLANVRVWRAAEVRDWTIAGCPHRSVWIWSRDGASRFYK